MSSSRPSTTQGQTLEFNRRRNIVTLGEQLQASQAALTILTESKPKPTERDREHVSGKVKQWSSPRRSNRFLWAINEVIHAFTRKSKISVSEKAWYKEIEAHQEERGTHALGDRSTLLETLKSHRAMKRETFQKMDAVIFHLEKKQCRYARGAIELETAFENGLQHTWEMKRAAEHARVETTVQEEMDTASMALHAMANAHMVALQKLRKKMKRSQKDVDEKKAIASRVLALKDLEIVEERKRHEAVKVQIRNMQKELVEKEWLHQKDQELKSAVDAAVGLREEEYAVMDAIVAAEKAAALAVALAAAVLLEEEAKREAAVKGDNEQGEKGTKKKGRK